MFKKTKPVTHYFPTLPVAIEHLCNGLERYQNNHKYVLDNKHVRGVIDGVKYIDIALAAIMVATGKEPDHIDCINTPAATYGWTFNEMRDILSALGAISYGNFWYWNTIYNNGEGTKATLPPLTSETILVYRIFANELKTVNFQTLPKAV